MKLMGHDVEKCGDGGGISVQGDTTILNTAPWWLYIALLLLTALCLGLAAPFIYQWLMCDTNAKPTPAVVAPAEVQDWKLGVIVTDQP